MSAAERDLLVAVQEALTLPYSTAHHDQRISFRAMDVSAAVKGYLDEGDPEWHAKWLRGRICAEEARHAGGAP
ncbi:hypothetical protein [Streptomyces galilaeus]|uniref:hypothetical protein n=1 Tax=Streptomyces galilaeus TaxID=33899 RepID=UPI0038F775A6